MANKTTYIYDYRNKEKNVKNHINESFNKSLTMFKYHNLPDTIPAKYLEKFLQENGTVCIAKHEDKLYAFNGALGGEQDAYGEPTKCVVSNPYLNLTKEFVIGEDCIIIDNDYLRQGMKPIFNKYATFLNENEISIMIATINTRITAIISAGDSNTVESAKDYLRQIEEGKLGVIADNAFLDSLKINQLSTGSNHNVLDDLIRLNQYLKASLLNSIGLNANTMLKKERLITAEVEASNDGLYPMVDNMLDCRRIGIEKVNKMFGTEIEVEFNSSWDYRELAGMTIHNSKEEISLEELKELSEDEVSKEEKEGNINYEGMGENSSSEGKEEFSEAETANDTDAGDADGSPDENNKVLEEGKEQKEEIDNLNEKE